MPLVGSGQQFPWQIDPNATFPELDDLDPNAEADLDLPADPDLERLTTAELRHRATRAMRALHAVASPRVPAPSPPEAPQPAEPAGSASGFSIPDGKLRDRLLAYANWVAEVTGCVSFRIVDPQGYSLLELDGDNDPRMVDCALKLIAALEEARSRMTADSPRAGLYLPLSDDEWLGVLECESTAGRMCISLVTRAPLSKAAAAELIDTLRRTVDLA